jgi:hypothetical protein
LTIASTITPTHARVRDRDSLSQFVVVVVHVAVRVRDPALTQATHNPGGISAERY